MQFKELPDDIVLNSVSVFRKGKRKYDTAALRAFNVFLNRIEKGEIEYEEARDILKDENKIEDFIARVRKISLSDAKARQLAEEKDRDRTLALIAKNTDPELNRKSSFRTNIQAGAIYFLAGLVASPFFSIVFKKPIEKFDKWLNGENEPKIEISLQKAPVPDFLQMPQTALEQDKTTGRVSPNVLPCEEDNALSGALLPEKYEVLKQTGGNKRSCFRIRKPNVCDRPNPPLACKPQAARREP